MQFTLTERDLVRFIQSVDEKTAVNFLQMLHQQPEESKPEPMRALPAPSKIVETIQEPIVSYPEKPNPIWPKVEKFLKKRNWTQGDLARLINVRPDQISKLKCGIVRSGERSVFCPNKTFRKTLENVVNI